METIIWIQNKDENNDDFVFDNFILLNSDKMENQQQLIGKMLDSKRKSKEILIEPYLKVYNIKNKFVIDIKSDDLDNYGRKGAVMVYIEGFQKFNDEDLIRCKLKSIFKETSTIVPENYIDTSSFSVMIKSKPIPKKFLLRFIENSVKTGIFYKELIPVDMLKFSIVSNKDFDSIYSENLLKYPQIIYEMDLWGRLTNKSVIRLLDNKLGTQTKAVINREKKILIKCNKKDVEIFHYLYKINIEETLVQTYLDDFYNLIYKISDYSDKPILYYINDSGIEYPYFNKLFGMSAYPKDDCFENLTKLNVISI